MQNTLTSLLVSENDITHLPGENDLDNAHHQQEISSCIRDLQVLSTLNIDGNKIINLDQHMLPKNLQTLSISNNLLTEMPSTVIDSLKRLQWLDLRLNQITELPLNYSFRPYRQMEKIDLGENRIKYLPREVFNNSMQVRNFILDFNLIEKISNDVFSGVNCGRLILSYNQIGVIHGRGFFGIDSSLEYLDLEHNRLMTYPVLAFGRLNILKYLYLSSNYLKEIPELGFSSFSHSLRALSLSGNFLTKIPNLALENCTKLSYLNLGYNQILEVYESDLGLWAENLNTLILRSNRITYIDQGLFNFTKNLRELSLSFNPINYIHPLAFVNISETIETLEISFAIVEEQFPQELLKPLRNLLWLSIDNNNIELLQKNALSSLEQIQYLTMESNKITSLAPNTFRGELHQQLTDLRLSNNRIELLESNTFSSLNSLHSILLGGNYIRRIESKAFNNLTSLIKIVLSNNRIKEIQHGAFNNLPILTKLDLQHNALFSFSMDTLINSTSKQYPIHLNLSHNDIFEILPPKDIIHVANLDLNHNNLQVPPKYMLEKISTSLRRLYLSYNKIESLELEAFGLLEELEELKINSNLIGSIKKHAFVGLDALHLLDLSCNDIQSLHVGQFSYLRQLRTLDLSSNNLRYLPKDIFRNTQLEKLKLSHNEFTTIPSAVLTDIGMTLRDLSINNNNIEHIDSTMFLATPYILNLDLSHNRLTLLPDNVFTSLGNIQRLNLNSNPLRANFKELFHYAQSLKYLNLANIGLHVVPQLPLPNLVFLNISANQLDDVSKWSLKALGQLRVLVLRHNMLKQIPAHVWSHLPALKRLELSYNPIKVSYFFYILSSWIFYTKLF